MRELTKSMTSFTWAMSLFGAKQMLNLMEPSKASDAFDSVAHATEGQLDDALRSAYRAGDRLQRSVVDATFSLMTVSGLLDPSTWTSTTRRAMDQATQALGMEDDRQQGGRQRGGRQQDGRQRGGRGEGGAGGNGAPEGARGQGSSRTGWGPVPPE